MLGSTGPPLGIVPMRTASAPLTIEFGRGDTLALITDGVFEAENADGEELGQEAVTKMIRDASNLSCADAARVILGKVDEYRGDSPQADDITIVLLRRRD